MLFSWPACCVQYCTLIMLINRLMQVSRSHLPRKLLILCVTVTCSAIYIVSLKYNQSPGATNKWWDTCVAHVCSSMLMLALPWDSYPLWCAQVLFVVLPPLFCCLSGQPRCDSLISPSLEGGVSKHAAYLWDNSTPQSLCLRSGPTCCWKYWYTIFQHKQ